MFRTISSEGKSAANPQLVFGVLIILLLISIIFYAMLCVNFIDSTGFKPKPQLDEWLHLLFQLIFPIFLGVLVSFLGQTAKISSMQVYDVSVKMMLMNGFVGLALAVLLATGAACGLFILAPRLSWLSIDIETALPVFFPASAFLLGLYSDVGLQWPISLRGAHPQVEGQTVGKRVFGFLWATILSILLRSIACDNRKRKRHVQRQAQLGDVISWR